MDQPVVLLHGPSGPRAGLDKLSGIFDRMLPEALKKRDASIGKPAFSARVAGPPRGAHRPKAQAPAWPRALARGPGRPRHPSPDLAPGSAPRTKPSGTHQGAYGRFPRWARECDRPGSVTSALKARGTVPPAFFDGLRSHRRQVIGPSGAPSHPVGRSSPGGRPSYISRKVRCSTLPEELPRFPEEPAPARSTMRRRMPEGRFARTLGEGAGPKRYRGSPEVAQRES